MADVQAISKTSSTLHQQIRNIIIVMHFDKKNIIKWEFTFKLIFKL